MLRSFTDRVLAGVCGGLGASLRVNPWMLRALLVVLTVISLGAFIVPYLLLWWLVAQESFLLTRQRRFPPFIALVLFILTGVAWVARTRGWLMTAAGGDLFWAGAVMILALVFFARQLGGFRPEAARDETDDGARSSRTGRRARRASSRGAL